MYLHYRAAKYMGVAPWDLDEAPVRWRDWALLFMAAETHAQKDIDRRAQGQRNRYQPGRR